MNLLQDRRVLVHGDIVVSTHTDYAKLVDLVAAENMVSVDLLGERVPDPDPLGPDVVGREPAVVHSEVDAIHELARLGVPIVVMKDLERKAARLHQEIFSPPGGDADGRSRQVYPALAENPRSVQVGDFHIQVPSMICQS